jgi:hypothetical protein
MKINWSAFAVCLACFAASSAYASPAAKVEWPEVTRDPVTVSSSNSGSLPDAPDAAAISAASMGESTRGYGRNSRLRLETPPFSQWAVATTVGLGGMGVQVSTALATKINLRVGGSFLNLNPVVVEQGIPIDGAVRLRTLAAAIDVFPYRGTFHISPGLTMYNGNRMTAVTNIVPGSQFTIEDTVYTSDITDPVHGTFDVSLGKRFAPSLTMGFGNMLKRSKNWTVQTDFGVQFVGRPNFVLNMTGTACDVADGCTRIQDDPNTVANLAQQQSDINQDIQPLRFYPILTVGVGYRFGHKTATTYWR